MKRPHIIVTRDPVQVSDEIDAPDRAQIGPLNDAPPPDDEMPSSVEDFRKKYGRDPATDAEMEFYFGQPEDDPEMQEERAPVPPGERYNPNLTPDDAEAERRGWLDAMPDELSAQSRMSEQYRTRRVSEADRFLAEQFPTVQPSGPQPAAPAAPSSEADEAQAARAAAAGRVAKGAKSAARENAGAAGGRSVMRDVVRGAAESPKQIAGGIRDAFQAAYDLGDYVADLLEEKIPLGGVQIFPPKYIPPGDPRLKPDKTGVKLPEIDKAKTVTGGIVREVAQFLTGFGFAGKVIGETAKGAPIVRAAIMGALSDFTAFDGHEKRLSDLIEQYPALQNPVTDFLKSDPNDGEIEGRTKRALEGLGLGVVVEGLIRSLRYLRDAKRAKTDVEGEMLAREEQRAPEARPLDLLGREDMPLVAKGDEEIARLVGETRKRQQTSKVKGAVAETETGVPDDVALRALTPDGLRVPGAHFDPMAGFTPLFGEGSDRFFVNFLRINAEGDVKRVISDMVEAFADDIEKARRGVRTHAQTVQAAGSVDAWKTLMARRQGAPLNAEESVAMRRLWEASGAKLLEVAQIAKRDPTPENLFQGRRMVAIHHAIQREAMGARAETARALNSWKIPVGGGGAERLQAIEAVLSGHGGAEVSEVLLGRIAALARLPNGMAVLDGMVERAVFARSVDVVKEVWVNSLLSHPGTHVVNVMGNSAAQLMNLAERSAAAGYSRALGSGDIMPGEAAAMAFGARQGLQEAFVLFARGLKTGERQFAGGMSQAQDAGVSRRAVSSKHWNIDEDNWLGRGVDGLGTLVNMPVRFLSAEDDFFKALAYRMEVNAQAFRQAQREVNNGTLAKDLIGPRIREIVDNPPEYIRLASMDAALYQTFTRKPGAFVEAINRADARLSTGGAGGQIGSLTMRILMPFRNTPGNLMRYTFERTPLAPLSREYQEAVARGGADADIARTRMALGTMVLLALTDLAFDGHITAAGPKAKDGDRGTRDTLVRTGWQPYAVKAGDKYVSYKRTDPVGMSLGIAASIAEVINNADNLSEDKREEISKVTAAAAFSFGAMMLDKSYMTGVADFIEAIRDEKLAPRLVDKNVASLMVPNTSRFLRNIHDPYMRYTQDLVTEMKNRIGGLSEDLPMAHDMWGRPIKFQSGMGDTYDAISPVYVRTLNPEPIDAEALKQDFNLRMPEWRLQSGRGVTLSLRNRPEIYSRLLDIRGNLKPSEMGEDGALLVEKYGDVKLLDLVNGIVSGTYEGPAAPDQGVYKTGARKGEQKRQRTGFWKEREAEGSLAKVYASRSNGRNGGKDDFITRIVKDYTGAATARLEVEFPDFFAKLELKRRRVRGESDEDE